MKKFFGICAILFVCGCAPTVSKTAEQGSTSFRVHDGSLQRNTGSGWETLFEAAAVSANTRAIYAAHGGTLSESADGGETWQDIFSNVDRVTDVEALESGHLWISVANWGRESGINMRSPDGTWSNKMWNNCLAVDPLPIFPTAGATALVKEGGYERYWTAIIIGQFAPMIPAFVPPQ